MNAEQVTSDHKRTVKEMDLLRAFAITALLVTHLHTYVNHDVLWAIFPYTTVGCLATFVFVSGYVISFSSQITSWPDVVCFLRRRFIRIYLLYVPSLITYMLVHPRTNTFGFFIVHLASLEILLARFIEPCRTLWFIGIIVPYYVIYALVKKVTSNLNGYLYTSVAIFSCGLIFNHTIHLIDTRLFVYYPAFVFGVFVYEKGYPKHMRVGVGTILLIVCISASLVGVYMLIRQYMGFSGALGNRDLREVIKCLLVIPISSTMLYLSQHAVKIVSDQLYSIARYMSIASFAVYLFHRQVLDSLKNIEPMSIRTHLVLQYVVYACVAVPLMFPVCFYIQGQANRLINHWRSCQIEVPRIS